MSEEPLKPEHLKVRLLRALSGKTQEQMGEEVGIYPSRIAQWEQGLAVPGPEILRRLAEQAGIGEADADELLRLYEAQRKAWQRRSAGTGPLLDHLSARLTRYGSQVARRILKIPPSEQPPSAEDRLRAEEAWRKLVRVSARSRLALVRAAAELQTWALCERCCEESVRKASSSVKHAAAWARLALEIAKLMPGSESWRARIRAYALAFWGNVLRVRGELDAVEPVFAEAKRLWQSGADPGVLLDPGRILELEASLRRDQRRFEEALALLDQASAIGRLPERYLIKKGFTFEAIGDYERAIEALLQAEPLVERQGDSRLMYMLRFNLAVNHCHLGRYSEASDLLKQVSDLVTERRDEVELNRVLWLEGRILAGLGRSREARHRLAEARQRFEAEGMSYDVALALLEEAALLLEEGRPAEVRTLAGELAVVFESKGVHREALAALRLFQEAAQREQADAELARRVLRYLFRARHDQGLRFES
jgi:transcriptional regulator with XRE-family HTH domain